jgi:hypothetical protein
MQEVDNGLNVEENTLIDMTVVLWNTFLSTIDSIHSDDIAEFRRCIHQIQSIIVMQSMRRKYPNFWH